MGNNKFMLRVETSLIAKVLVVIPPNFPVKQIHRSSGFRLVVLIIGKKCTI